MQGELTNDTNSSSTLVDTDDKASSTQDVAKRVLQAFLDKDKEAIERVLSDDFHFSSPRDNRLDREGFFQRCWPGNKAVRELQFVHTAAQGDQVFIIYEMKMRGGLGFRNVEVYTVHGEHVSEIEVYFGWNLPHPAAEGGFIEENK